MEFEGDIHVGKLPLTLKAQPEGDSIAWFSERSKMTSFLKGVTSP